jgi:hemerythrin-like domain-containing protein
LLRNHIYKEESALFDLIETTLSNEQDRQVVAELSKFDAALTSGEELLRRLRMVEDKYLRRRSA